MKMANKKDNNRISAKELRDAVPLHLRTLLTLKEACAHSGIACDVIYEIIARPDVDFVVKHGNKNFIHREKFDRWLANIKEF